MYNPGDKIFVQIDFDGNCSITGNTLYVETTILVICDKDKEYLVVANDKIKPNAFVCSEDWKDEYVQECFGIINDIEKYDGMSVAWIRPKYTSPINKKNNISELNASA